MIVKKVMIQYISNDFLKTKKKIEKIINDFGIFEYELIEDFELNKLDYNENFNFKKEVWGIIFYMANNRFFDKKIIAIKKSIDDKIDEDEFTEIYTSNLDTDSYKDEWKKSFFTTKIGNRLVINPSWIDYEKKEEEIVINIDSSEAFGTGTHPTTSLCIKLIEKYLKNDMELLDIGCGSGILMIVSSLLGAKFVEGIDIDPKCIKVVERNCEFNKINNYKVYTSNLVDNENKKYDIVVSNILVDVLEKLLQDIQKVLKKGTLVIFSGIIEDKKEKFITKCNNIGLKLLEENKKDIWHGLVLRYE